MDIESLRSFVIVTRTGNLTRAANELFVTQPTLSRRIAALEEELGMSLLVRSHDGVRPTVAGLRLSREAEDLVSRVDALPTLLSGLAEAERGKDELTGTLHVVSQAMLDDTLPSAFMAAVMSAHTTLDVQVARAYPPDIRTQLSRGTCDVGLFLRPVASSTSQLLTRKLGESRVQLIVYDGHPFSEREWIDIRELTGEDVVMLDRRVSPEIVDFISARCVDAGFTLNAVRYVRDAENAAVLVSAGRGVSFIHSMMRFAQPLETVGIRVVDIVGADLAIDYVARLRPGLSDALRDAVLDVLDELETSGAPNASDLAV